MICAAFRDGHERKHFFLKNLKEWEGVQVPSDRTLTEFERFIIDNARSRGVDIKKPFPFIVAGEITDYA